MRRKYLYLETNRERRCHRPGHVVLRRPFLVFPLNADGIVGTDHYFGLSLDGGH